MVKDAKLEEKEVQVIHGAIFADEFRDRSTGKEIGGDSGSYSKNEVDDLLALKVNKIGELPFVEVNGNEKVIDRINEIEGKPIVIDFTHGGGFGGYYIGLIRRYSNSNNLYFEFEALAGPRRFYSLIDVTLTNSTTFNDIFAQQFLSNYVQRKEVSIIHKYDEGTVLYQSIFNNFKNGDILQVDSTFFIVSVQANANPKKIIGNCISSITSTTISIYSLNWTFEEELHPVLTNFTIGSVE